jgi:hypothetical protein
VSSSTVAELLESDQNCSRTERSASTTEPRERERSREVKRGQDREVKIERSREVNRERERNRAQEKWA